MPMAYRSLALCFTLYFSSTALVCSATMEELMHMGDQFDKLDKADFGEWIAKANSCIHQRDFDCTEAGLAKAAKLVNGSRDRTTLATARQRLEDERELVRQEEAQRLARLQREEDERRRLEEEEEKLEANADRIRRCEDSCGTPGSLNACYQGQITSGQCDAYEARNGSGVNYGAAIFSGVNSALAGKVQIDAIHNRSMAQMQAAYAERARQEQMQRDRLRVQQQAERRRIQEENQAAAARRRASPSSAGVRETERTNQNTQAHIGARQAGVDLVALDRSPGASGMPANNAAEQRQKDAEAAARRDKEELEAREHRERERKDKAEKERSEIKAQREAEKAAKAQTKADYLAKVLSGSRLMARQCFGGQYIVGTRPRIAPEVVSCVDVHYRAQCVNDGNKHFIDGVGKTFVGIGTDCYSGDTYAIEPRLSCDVKDIRVTLREVRACNE